MTPRVQEQSEDIGRCGCGRSPTGKCIGWHGLSEELYQHKRRLWLEEELAKDNDVEYRKGDTK